MKKTIDGLRDYLLENFVDDCGDLDLEGLDFSDFNGDVIISGMRVKGSLFKNVCEVGGDLYQGNIIVKGDYVCRGVKVGGSIYADEPTKLLKEVTRKELAEMGFEVID